MPATRRKPEHFIFRAKVKGNFGWDRSNGTHFGTTHVRELLNCFYSEYCDDYFRRNLNDKAYTFTKRRILRRIRFWNGKSRFVLGVPSEFKITVE